MVSMHHRRGRGDGGGRAWVALGVGLALWAGSGAVAAADAGAAFKQAIDSLAAGAYWSKPFVENTLSARLVRDWENEYTLAYKAESGRFAGLRIKEVELRCSKRRARDCLLSIDLAEPGPPNMAFVRKFWPQAEPTPASPHSRFSHEYWTIERGPDQISVSNQYDAPRITRVTVALNTQRLQDPLNPPPVPPQPLPPVPENP